MKYPETQIKSYRTMANLGKKQATVLNEIIKHQSLTSQELARHLGWSINRITGRVKELAEKVENRVLCAAEFMGKEPELLEAQRKILYEKMPVPSGWHEAYAKGKAGFEGYL